MGILQNISRFTRSFFSPNGNTSASMSPYNYSASMSTFNTENNPTVVRCENLISDTLGSIDLSLYIRSKGGGRTKAVFNSLFFVIQNPSIEESPTLFYSTLIKHILHFGNGFIYKIRDSQKNVIGLQIINPITVNVQRDKITGNKVFIVGDKTYTSSDIVHIPAKNGYDGTIGHAIRETANKYIILDNVLEEYIANYFQFSLGSRLILTLNKENAETKDADKAYVKLLEWVNKYIVGAQNAGKPLISPPNGTLDTINQTSNAESDLATLKQATEKHIADFYGLPYSILTEANTYNSLEQRQRNFISTCIKPLGYHIAETLTNALLTPTERSQTLFLDYDYSDLIEADIKAQLEYLSRGLLAGIFTINQAKARMGLDSIGPIGDITFADFQHYPLTQENIDAFFATQKLKLEAGNVSTQETIDSEHNAAGDDKG